MTTFYQDLDWCIEHRRPHALLIPWVNNSRDSLAAVDAGLLGSGWAYNAAADRYERGGWYVWMRSQGELSSPIAQFDRIEPWGDEVNGWGDDDDDDDGAPTCPDCGDYTEGGLCSGCRSNESVRSQLKLF